MCIPFTHHNSYITIIIEIIFYLIRRSLKYKYCVWITFFVNPTNSKSDRIDRTQIYVPLNPKHTLREIKGILYIYSQVTYQYCIFLCF